MAITVNVDVVKALNAMGLDVQPLLDKGVKIAPFVSGAKFVSDGEVIAQLPAAPAKLSEIGIKGYDAKKADHKTLKANAESAIQNALDYFKADALAVDTPTAKVKATAKAAQPAGVELFPTDQMKSATPVPLTNATALYQPVKGTSGGSRYYVVGVSEGIKVAARWKATQLSVRVEGPKFAKVAPTLIEGGLFGPEFAGQYNDDYASMHVEIAGKSDAQKVVGAVLGLLNDYIAHPVPNMNLLENI